MSIDVARQPARKTVGGFLRGRLTFSLRTLLLVVTAFCIWLGWQSYLAREQREAVVALHLQTRQDGQEQFPGYPNVIQNGGLVPNLSIGTSILNSLRLLNDCPEITIVYDFQEAYFNRFGRLPSEKESEPQWLSAVFGVDFCHRVKLVHIRNFETLNSEELLANLKRLPHLEKINFESPINFCGTQGCVADDAFFDRLQRELPSVTVSPPYLLNNNLVIDYGKLRPAPPTVSAELEDTIEERPK